MATMLAEPQKLEPQNLLEDPLAHLPCSSVLEYRKGQVIYYQDQPSGSVYLVIDGKVKVCRIMEHTPPHHKARWGHTLSSHQRKGSGTSAHAEPPLWAHASSRVTSDMAA